MASKSALVQKVGFLWVKQHTVVKVSLYLILKHVVNRRQKKLDVLNESDVQISHLVLVGL